MKKHLFGYLIQLLIVGALIFVGLELRALRRSLPVAAEPHTVNLDTTITPIRVRVESTTPSK